MVKRLLNFATNKIYDLPIVVMMPHSRCNCRCIMCDIWKANSEKRELSVEQIQPHVDSFLRLGVREIVFSGGEALMHSNFWNLCQLLKKGQIKLTLLSTGLLLEKNAEVVVSHLDNVIVSIDGSREVHDRIRAIPNGFDKLASGVAAVKVIKNDFRITARCVLQRYNFRDFENIVTESERIGIDQISFLAADISTTAFNHLGLDEARVSEIALTPGETEIFEEIIKKSFVRLASHYDSKFIAESPAKMLRLVQYYRAMNGMGKFPETRCNAPWVSAVIESNGDVMPCFFHKPYGNIHDQSFNDILNSQGAVNFRKRLNVQRDDICKKCVCSLNIGITR